MRITALLPSASSIISRFIFLLTSAVGSIAFAGNYLHPENRLHLGQNISSANGKYSLVMQTDGNLVMYGSNGSVRYHFAGSGSVAIMQGDGNFVEYNILGSPVWHAGTWGHPGSFLHIQDDGNLVVYHPSWTPLWQIGPAPAANDPRLPPDVVARDLNAPIGGFLGHTALYDGNGSVIQAQYINGNAVNIRPLEHYKNETDNFWGAASPNIPSGRTSRGCYRSYCYSANDFEQFEMRVAIIRAAYATSQIGANYTITAQWIPSYWGNRVSMPQRGTFRCDTFVLAMLAIPPYESSSAAQLRWKGFIQQFAYRDDKNPKLVFDRLRAYR